ncbi:hypothetical protein [Acinetobacter sp. ANC5681]|uniref:hypothetical protein n=1 Tax=Acinetobacter sp. ANC5681 TaxID=2929504 RepID=UPI00201AAB07|nr:hypothetical protein [Acinetobacter sp. ANC5681]MCL5769545.1 hypothetical protein [Acinetobacter sp. ANC5681]
MPIETNNLVLYKSERLTDTSDGGGKYSGQVVTDGESNNLFPDVSELDRTMGRVSLRKIYAAVNNNDTESLMGSTVFVSKNPDDPNVSALLFSTKSHTDTRDAAQNRLENYLAKGAQAVGSLLDTAYSGMKSFQVVMSSNESENSIGDTIVLVVNEGTVNEFAQYVRITSVETRTATLRVNNSNIEYKVATYSFQDPLSRDFVGVSALQWYNNAKPAATLRDSIVADAGVYYASVELADDVAVGSFTIQAESIFSQLIPSSQTETPLLDLNAVSENTTLAAGNSGTITTQFTTNVNTSQALYLGSSVMPASVSFTLFGQNITDNGGTLRTATGTQVGTIDYQTGRIVWTNAIGSGNATISITFKPASAPVQPFESYALPVTANNQGTNWTGVLVPIPAPGALSVSFMSQGKFYVLKDNGTGRLVAANESIGSGSINYTTGTWLLTTGALPDVGTPILLQWGSPITTFARADLSVSPAGVDFQLFHNGIVSLTATWLLDGETKSATVNSAGQFTGDATGFMTFNTGKGRLIPNKLPQKNTVFTLSYNYGEGKSQTKTATPDANNKLLFTIGTGSAIQPSSVGLEIPLASDPNNGKTGVVFLHDVPVNETTGNLVDEFGNIQGSIIYATGSCEVTPTAQSLSYRTIYTPLSYVVMS